MAKASSTSSSDRVPWGFLLPVAGAIVLACIVLDPLITHGMAWCNPSFGSTKVHRMFTELHPQEVVILGSSRADGSYVPEMIHPEAWNYGIEMTGYPETRLMLKCELSKTKRTPIIINFDYSFFTSSKSNIAHFIPELRQPAVNAMFASQVQWYNYLPTIRYMGIMDEYLKAFIAEHRNTLSISSRGGYFVNLYSPTVLQALARKRESTPITWVQHPEDEIWLNLLASTNRTIILVVAPYHQSYRNAVTNPEAIQHYLARMDSLPNVQVINLSKMPLPDSCFQDPIHVNWTGAVRFTQALRSRLDSLGLVPARSN